jgi:hypothetical protein
MRFSSLRAAILGCAILTGAASHVRAQAFVDFHARSGPDLVGHAFIVYGTLDADGRIASSRVTGFYTDEPSYFKGLVVPLPGFVGSERDDFTEKSAVVYRRTLTASQLRELQAGVARLKAASHKWHMIFFNCNDFVGEIAELVGLRRPPSLMLPVAYVAMLGTMNGLSRPR